MEIGYIQERVKAGDFRFTKHATIQRINRHVTVEEVREAILCGEIIEKYKDDKYCPSVLILGFTQKQRPLHVLCSSYRKLYNSSHPKVSLRYRL